MLNKLRSAAGRIKRVVKGPPPEIRESEIPPQAINYNSAGGDGYAEYAHLYKKAACLIDIPLLIKKADFSPSSSILDYGCGLGRLAYAASKFLSVDGEYYGYEPNQTALAFLKEAYKDRPNFHFDGQPLNFDEDYVAKVQSKQASNTVGALDVDLKSFVKNPVDVQWSVSVFTHMWPDAITHILKSMKHVVKPGGLCINSWLAIDDFVAYVLRCGLADRKLPYQINQAFTYSEENPLVCTAYRIETIREIYENAGHEIVEIIWGSWGGKENPNFYQDTIISRIR